MKKVRCIYMVLFFIPPFFSNAQEKVFYNAKIFTADQQQPFAEAIAIRGKFIVAVGNYRDIKKKVSSHATWMDMKGGFLMPGLIDTHDHAIWGGKASTKSNLDDRLLSVDALLNYAKSELKKKEGMTGDVLVIYGINISTWTWLNEIITIFNKDEFATQSIVLRGSDYHTSWSNHAMLLKAGIDKSYVDGLKPGEKQYFGITTNGGPNGFVSESGYSKIAGALLVEKDFSKAAEIAMAYHSHFGITALLDPGVASFIDPELDVVEWYPYLKKKGKLTAHITATVIADANADPHHQIIRLKRLQKKYNNTDFSIIGFKVYADGVIEYPTQTAALSIPYTGTQSRGDLLFEPKKFAKFVTLADKNNLLMHVHAIGDRAVTETLNGFEVARKTNRNLNIPHTITHLQIVKPSDFLRFKQLHVLSSFQLFWAFGDVTTIDMVKPYIHPSLYQWQYPVRSMMHAGVVITGASDWPVTTANPFEAIRRAETRKGPLGVLDSTQCMPRLTMLYAYTSAAAEALMMEKKIGSLHPGKYADMILVDRDVLTVNAEAIGNTKVLWTMFKGEIIYTSIYNE